MAITTVQNGQIGTAKYYNSIGSSLDTLKNAPANQYGARVWRSTAQSITSNTDTNIQFSQFGGSSNNGSMWSNTLPERVYAPIAGYYAIAGSVRWDAYNGGARQLRILMNGGTPIASQRMSQQTGTSSIDQHVFTYYRMDAGEYVTLNVRHGAGAGSLNVLSVNMQSPSLALVCIAAVGISAPSAYLTPPTIPYGGVVDDVYLNYYIKNDIDTLETCIGCRSLVTGGTASFSNGWSTIGYGSDVYNTGGATLHNSGTNNERFTAPASGYYGVSAGIGWVSGTSAGGSSDLRQLRIAKVASGVMSIIATATEQPNSSNQVDQNISTVTYLGQGDYVFIQAYQDSGNPQNAYATGTYSLVAAFHLLNYAITPPGYGAPLTINVGDIIPSAYYNQIRDNLDTLASSVGCRAYYDVNVGLPSTNVTLSCTQERYDTTNIHNTGSNIERFVAPISGWYIITSCISWAASSTGMRGLAIIWVNGSTSTSVVSDLRPLTNGSATTDQTVATIIYMTAGNYVYAQSYQNTGSNLTVYGGNGYSLETAVQLIGHG